VVPRAAADRPGALRQLEAAALANDFQPQEIANTLHALAKARYAPSDPRLLEALERQAEAVAGTFKAQEVANTLWAYATLGRAPGAGLMAGLMRAGAALRLKVLHALALDDLTTDQLNLKIGDIVPEVMFQELARPRRVRQGRVQIQPQSGSVGAGASGHVA